MVQHCSKIFVIIGCLLFSQAVLSAKILLVTDQSSLEKANEVKALFLTTKPFSDMQDLEIIIKKISKERVQCTYPLLESTKTETQKFTGPESCKKMLEAAKQGNADAKASAKTASRLLVCNTDDALMDMAGTLNVDRVIFIRESAEWAGAGGSSITMTTGTPASTAIHELMHSLGFRDEYGYYSVCEADTYCPRNVLYPRANLAVFVDLSPYASDAEARSKHSAQIPWYASIRPTTKITTGDQLGTPAPKGIGLYRVGVCDLATVKVKSWRPGSEKTIMESLSTTFIPETYWPEIVRQLGDTFEGIELKGVGGGFLDPAKEKKGVR